MNYRIVVPFHSYQCGAKAQPQHTVAHHNRQDTPVHCDVTCEVYVTHQETKKRFLINSVVRGVLNNELDLISTTISDHSFKYGV